MGYELSIQRTEDKPKITLTDWLQYMAEDDEFEPIEIYTTKTDDGDQLSIATPNAGLWTFNNETIPFTFSEEFGFITVKNPEKWIIEKMIVVADTLDAVVLGEENELYDQTYLETGQKSGFDELKQFSEWSPSVQHSRSKPWWKFWKS